MPSSSASFSKDVIIKGVIISLARRSPSKDATGRRARSH